MKIYKERRNPLAIYLKSYLLKTIGCVKARNGYVERGYSAMVLHYIIYTKIIICVMTYMTAVVTTIAMTFDSYIYNEEKCIRDYRTMLKKVYLDRGNSSMMSRHS